MSDRPVIGVGILVWRDKQLLLGRRLTEGDESCWQFPGGHLEAGESVVECASREVSEETGLRVNTFRQLGYTNKPFIVAQKNYITLFVSCQSDAGEAVVMEPEKCSEWCWFDEADLPQPLFEPISLFLQQHNVAHENRTELSKSELSSGAGLYALHLSSHEILGTQ